MYLAFVTPSSPGEEFILTENAFGIHEGPVSFTTNRLAGEGTMTAYTEFHLINVISPHIAMILRHNSLPEPLEDMIEEVCVGKRQMIALQAQMHADPDHATSLLHDLPIAKARNSYTVIKDGRLELGDDADGVPRFTDTFHFTFFRLASNHAQTINTVMLDQAHNISTLVFKTESALRLALEFYLSYPTLTKGLHSLKTVTDCVDDPRRVLLQKLEILAHLLGSEVNAKFHVDPLWDDDDDVSSFDSIITEVMLTAQPTNPNNPLELVGTVMMECLKRNQLTVMDAYVGDLISTRNGAPPFPNLIFNLVQRINPM
ncbi:hypothetical protein GQ44DRAFT_664358, partial [Phaeosphaeriaceae sp. PMI808]